MIGENQGLCVFPLYLQYITNYYIIYIYFTYLQYGFNFIYPVEKHEL